MDDKVTRSDANGLCTLTLNRPEKLNALDHGSFEQLDAHLAAIESATDTIGCIVLRGAGRGFCAGADLTDLNSVAPRAWKPAIVERLANLPQPLIVAVHGFCMTGGLELALTADLIVADATARFADTHGRWGLVCEWGMTQRLPRRIGQAKAKRMMLTARSVEAEEAERIGLADIVVPAGGLEAAVADLVAAILANSWHTNRATKRLLSETEGMPLADGLAHEHYRHPGYAPDWQERVARFSKK